MNKKVKPIPDGYHTLTPTLTVKDAKKAIEFYKKAFGAELQGEICLMPDGKVGHADIKIGDSRVMINDEFPSWGCVAPTGEAASTGLYVYVADADKTFKTAVAAGAKVLMPIADQFWGDRQGQVKDPFGHRWSIATHVEEPTPEQMKKRMEEMFAVAK